MKKQTDTVVFCNEHGGFGARETLLWHLKSKGYNVIDCGAKELIALDGCNDYVPNAIGELLTHPDSMGLFICGSGNMSNMMVNKIPGLFGALCRTPWDAQFAREHNNARVLCMGARCTSIEDLIQITDTFFTTKFLGGKYAVRMGKVDEVTQQIIKKFNL